MIESIIEKLKLVPLTGEGGMYRYLYAGEKDAAGRESYSSIYYLLTEHSFSHMHRLKTDEIYHYYMGDGLELLLLYPDGTSEIKVLGTRLSDGEVPQFRVPAGVWQGVGCGSRREILSGGNDDGPGVSAGGLRTW